MRERASLAAWVLAAAWLGSAANAQHSAQSTAQTTALTPFQNEVAQLLKTVPCQNPIFGARSGPSHGSQVIGFTCKGGPLGTVTLLIDAAEKNPKAIERIRLAYRQNTGGKAEAEAANTFLNGVLNRYVPAADAPRVRKAFLAGRNDRFHTAGTRSFTWREEKPGLKQYWLEVQRPLPQTAATYTAKTPAAARPTPADTSRGNAPESLMEKLQNGMVNVLGLNTAPSLSAPLPTVVAPSALNTTPAPESRIAPTPPPAISATLVPTPEMLQGGRAPAPTNFSEYNKAQQLTRDIEQRAAQNTTGLMQSPSPTQPRPQATLPGVPTPQVQQTPAQTPASTGLTLPEPQAPTQPAQPTEPRFTPNRALPQLQFIPKAEPLDTRTDVIRFEDEGSGL